MKIHALVNTDRHAHPYTNTPLKVSTLTDTDSVIDIDIDTAMQRKVDQN